MSIKLKLISFLSMFVLMLGVLIMGVFAIGQQTITLDGSVNFNIANKDLYIKDVRISNDNYTEQSVGGFLPGYINENFNLSLSTVSNQYGSFSLHFDIINTTTLAYDVTVSYPSNYQSQNIEVTVNSEIPASPSEITEITDTTPTTEIVLMITNPNGYTINLSDITINISEQAKILEDFTFEGNVLTAYTGTASDLVIPGSYSIVDGQYVEGNDYTVTEIGDGAVSGLSSLISVTIPSCIQSIGDNAFTQNEYLETVKFIGNSQLTTIGEGAFAECFEINELHIPASVVTIERYAFSNTNLEVLEFNEGSQLESIGMEAFAFALISEVTIPASVTYLGVGAFGDCRNLSSVTFENTTGWQAGTTSLSSSDLSNRTTAATYLTDTYDNREWTRS